MAYRATGTTYGPTLIPIAGSLYVDDLEGALRSSRQLQIPSNVSIAFFRPDGTTAISPGEDPASLLPGNSVNHPVLLKPVAECAPGSSSASDALIGQVFSVKINQSKLLNKYLTPAGSRPATPAGAPLTHTELLSVALNLEDHIFEKSSTARPCIVIEERPERMRQVPVDRNLTIVLISSLQAKPLREVMAEEDLNRVAPIFPTTVQPGVGPLLHTEPEWIPHVHRRIPSYAICMPINVHRSRLQRFEDSFRLDAESLALLQNHVISMGSVISNADYQDSEEDETDDFDYADDGSDCDCQAVDPYWLVKWEEVEV